MNKKKIVLASTLAVLLAPSVLNNLPANHTVQAANTQLIGTVRRGGAATVDANGNYVRGGYLGNFTSWRLDQRITIGGNPYYEVATNQYVDATAMNISNGNQVLNPVQKEVSYVNAVKTITGSNAVVVNDNGYSLGVTLPNGTSWRVDQYKVINGYPYYRVATNEWVKALNFTSDYNGTNNTTTNTNTNVLKTITLRTNSVIYNGQGQNTGKTLPSNSSWKVSQEKNINGHQYYQVATNEWILATEDKNTSVFSNGATTGTLAKNIQLYNTASNSMTRSLSANTSWKISNVVENSAGYYFAQVSNNEWIPLGGSVFSDGLLQQELANSATYEPSFAISLFK
ncbi:SLAP domain-containing protein [Companilactobacillus sp. HBUAS56275]|uniref:SLAP domain-containing protein n=1 Tax=Candidatus Companilactobacillus pullicola TaxID=2838523 RepID=A0A9D1ZLN7_9LACO|nr:SLAP domain-containing protein [Candidatus Companilactobacillus pullicola]